MVSGHIDLHLYASMQVYRYLLPDLTAGVHGPISHLRGYTPSLDYHHSVPQNLLNVLNFTSIIRSLPIFDQPICGFSSFYAPLLAVSKAA
jgi:hypothetical protein